MLVYTAAYVAALIAFVVVDATWLTTMGAALYRSVLGDILQPSVNFSAAIAFYLLYSLGIVIFAVAPALRTGSASTALTYGALFGLFTYATYDLTNYATLRNWTLKLTLIDIVYGAIAVALAAAIAFFVAQRFQG